MDERINPADVVNYLTVRYRRTGNPTPPPLTWSAFTPKEGTEDSFTRQAKEKLVKSLRSIPPETLGVEISGGVDSTLIVAYLREISPNATIRTFSAGFGEEEDELEDARSVVEAFSTDRHELIIDHPLRELPQMISIMKEPKWNLYPYYLARFASRHTKVLLTGEGGDELFGGYAFRYVEFLKRSPQTVSEKVQTYLDTHQRDWVPDQEKLFGPRVRFNWSRIHGFFEPYFSNDLPTLGQVFLADFNGKLLYDFLPVDEAFAQAFGLKSGTPFLSLEMIEFATHIPYEYKYDEATGLGKPLLRKLLAELPVPRRLVTKPKKGFGMNTVRLWEREAKEICRNLLDRPRVVEEGWINRAWLERHLRNPERDQDVRYVNKFLGLLAFEVWYRLFVTKEMSPNEVLG